MERKDFLKKVTVGGSLLLASPAIFNACSNGTDDSIDDANNNNNDNGGGIEIDLSSSTFSALASVGGYAYQGNIIIIRSGESQYIALSKICTHEGCTVTYNSSTNELPCPCHGSKFSSSGAVLEGPANASLKTYSVSVNGNTLKIS